MTKLEELKAARKAAYETARVAEAAAEAAGAHSRAAFWAYTSVADAYEAEREKQKENK
jgi:hypothetical protein